MEIDLSEIGMEKGMQYETIISTRDSAGNLNASPFGVICRGKDNVMCRIFKDRKTLDNILSQKEFIVNICQDPELFTTALLENFEDDDFNENGSLKNVACYFRCEVDDEKEAIKQSDPLRKKSEAIVIKATVTELVIAEPVKAFNRAFGYVIENLINVSRVGIADEEQTEYYLSRFKECNRVVKKVGSKKEKESMDKIKNKYKEKGYEI